MTPLDALAARVGIEPGYHDIWGKHVEIGAEAKIAILGVLGIPARTEAEQAASLAELETRPWRWLAEPAAVIAAEHQPAGIAVVVPAGAPGSLSWRLEREDRGGRSGSVAPASLPLIDSRTVDGTVRERRTLTLPEALPPGYHRLYLSLGDEAADVCVIVAPRRCWGPDDVAAGHRFFGVACQLYALRRDGDWGIGGFPALGDLAVAAAAAGADTVGVNPLHAMFPVEPAQASPYSPASRDWLNVLYIDPAVVPEFDMSEAARALVADADFQRRLAAARAAELVDYPAVAALVLPVLEQLFETFRTRHLDTGSDRARAFQAFREEQGEALERFATFMALQQHFAGDDLSRFAWWTWPEDCQRPDGDGVARFRRERPDRVTFHAWLQWIADGQLRDAAEAGREAGLRIGIYRDLAVGVGPASAAAWASPASLVRGVAVGAPPDQYNLLGQNWGLAPLNPLVLRERAYRPFITALRANMRHAGALRIDHVMALQHLYWVPEGLGADKGAYVSYPFQDMLRILALESQRNRCLVVGEDLGTVPEGFRPAMAEAGVLSYRVMQFERVGDGLFKRSQTYPDDALVTVGTHDLPTIAGFWTGRDIEWRRQLGLYPDDETRDAEAGNRTADRRRLVDALIDAGLWPGDQPTDPEALEAGIELIVAVHRFVARAPSRLMMLQVEDALGLREQVNLPGTVDTHPNWRRRYPVPVDGLLAEPGMAAVLAAVAAERPR